MYDGAYFIIYLVDILLGALYQDNLGAKANGLTLTQRTQVALGHYEKAAGQGNAVAMRNIANIYYYGRGVEKDYVKARKYYERAAEQGDARALTGLGHIYRSGRGGVNRDYTKALEYYLKAAEKNNTGALFSLVELYMNGEGVKKDAYMVVKYLEQLAETGDVQSCVQLASIYRSGRVFQMGRYESLIGYRKAYNYYRRVVGDKKNRANKESELYLYYAHSLFEIAKLYHLGYGVPKNERMMLN